MKRFVILLSAALLLCSCAKKEFADDKKCADLGSGIRDALGDTQEYHEFDEAHINETFPSKESYDDRYIIYSADTNDINELGILHAASERHADALVEDCKRYIEDMQKNSRAFIESYAPEELPKLDAARVERVGNYVIYTVLPDDKADAIIDRVKSELKK